MPNERQSPLGAKTQENNDSLELKFLIEQHFKEVAHFWTRTNVFLITNVAAFGGVLSKIYSENPLSTVPLIIISLLGLAFCVIWYHVNRVAVYYEKRWLADARRLAQLNPQLKSVYYLSLGFREQKDHTKENLDWFGDQFLDLRRPRGFSATNWMYVIIILFGISWFGLFIGILLRLLPG